MDRDVIPIYKPRLPDQQELVQYLRQIDLNQWYSNYGPLVTEFEARIAKYCGVKPTQVVSVANATLGLEGAISCSDAYLESGSQSIWACPSWTFAASGSSLIRSGVLPVLCDVDQDWRVDLPSEILFDGVLDVLSFGDSVKANRFPAGIKTLIVDAAAAFDSLSLKNISFETNAGQLGLVISFHATKVLPAGEGGMFISLDEAWVARVRSWGNFGFGDNSRQSFSLGTNSKMSEYAAAVGLASLDNWESDRLTWVELQETATEISKGLGFEVQPSMRKRLISPYWIIQTKKTIRDGIIRSFKTQNIETRQWWNVGLHEMPAFRNLQRANLDQTKILGETTVGLPFFRDISKKQLQDIQDALCLAIDSETKKL